MAGIHLKTHNLKIVKINLNYNDELLLSSTNEITNSFSSVRGHFPFDKYFHVDMSVKEEIRKS